MKSFSKSIIISCAALAVAGGVKADNYAVNYPDGTKITHDSRYLESILLTSPSDGAQQMAVGQKADKLLYHDLTDYCFLAMPGETVSPAFSWESGLWMHGYVYIDLAKDGEFDVVVNADSTRVEPNCDLVSYSCFAGWSSTGAHLDALNVGVTPPSFTIPADLEPGMYRMRYKIDWNSVVPGGNDVEHGFPHQQLITTNGGAIADIMLYVHGNLAELKVNSDHGTVTNASGSPLDLTDFTPGSALTVKFIPDNEYQVKNVTVTSGYNLDLGDVKIASANLSTRTVSYAGYMISDNTLTIPAENMVGKVTIDVEYCDASEVLGGDLYACEISGDKDADKGITSIALASTDQTEKFDINTTARHFFFGTEVLHANKNNAQKFGYVYTGAETGDAKLYIDLNQNYVFDGELELVASAAAGAEMPEFNLDAQLPVGVYRCRLQVGNDCAVDFLLNIHNGSGALLHNMLRGYIVRYDDAAAMDSVTFGSDNVTIAVYPTMDEFTGDYATVRHGHNLFGDQYICGNRQWQEYQIAVGEQVVLPASIIDGDVMIRGEFDEPEDGEWTLIFNDEFDSPELNTDKWSYHPRYSSTWNKRVAKDEGRPYVNVFANGMYNSYAMPTPGSVRVNEGNIPMITGAIYSGGKFSLTGGYIEARILTNKHTGNFPAFWMMPANQPNGWPLDGEIDIMEQINTEDIAYHTVHTAWRYKSLGVINRESPAFGGNERVDMDEWHIYALEWDQDALKWYVDGELQFTYANQHYTEGKYTEHFTWPFSSPFYIILNQSVGDGSWAAAADTKHTYITKFDYVRAYQKRNNLSYYSIADGNVSAIDRIYADEAIDPNAPKYYYNLQGMQVDGDNLAPGIYIVKQGDKTQKILVK